MTVVVVRTVLCGFLMAFAEMFSHGTCSAGHVAETCYVKGFAMAFYVLDNRTQSQAVLKFA